MTDDKLTLVEKLVRESEIMVIGDVTYNIVSVQNGVVTALENREDTNVVYQEHMALQDLVKLNASLYRLTHFLDLQDLA